MATDLTVAECRTRLAGRDDPPTWTKISKQHPVSGRVASIEFWIARKHHTLLVTPVARGTFRVTEDRTVIDVVARQRFGDVIIWAGFFLAFVGIVVRFVTVTSSGFAYVTFYLPILFAGLVIWDLWNGRRDPEFVKEFLAATLDAELISQRAAD